MFGGRLSVRKHSVLAGFDICVQARCLMYLMRISLPLLGLCRFLGRGLGGRLPGESGVLSAVVVILALVLMRLHFAVSDALRRSNNVRCGSGSWPNSMSFTIALEGTAWRLYTKYGDSWGGDVVYAMRNSSQ